MWFVFNAKSQRVKAYMEDFSNLSLRVLHAFEIQCFAWMNDITQHCFKAIQASISLPDGGLSLALVAFFNSLSKISLLL